MPTIRWTRRVGGVRETLALSVRAGTRLLTAASEAGLPVARGCGEQSLCGRCALHVESRPGGVSPEDGRERECKRRNRVEPGLRLACRSEVRGDLMVSTPYW